MESNVISQASLALLLIEGLKRIVRLVIKNPAYDFSKTFYTVSLPISQVVAGLLLAVLGVSGFSLPTDWVSLGKSVILMVLGSFTTVLLYDKGYKPLKNYVPQAMKKLSANKSEVKKAQ